MSNPTANPTQARRSESDEIRQAYEFFYAFGREPEKMTIVVYEVVKCPGCDNQNSPCGEDADLHEKDIPITGLYAPCPAHMGCGLLLTTDGAPVLGYHFDSSQFELDEDGHRRAELYPLYPTLARQPLAELRKQAEPFKSPLMTTRVLLQVAGEKVDYLWDKYISPGLITFLISDGEVGKTTLTLSLLHHLLQGRPFLGKSTQQAKVIYISEEPAKLLGSKLHRIKESALTDSPLISWFIKGVTRIFKPGKDGAPELQPHDWDAISEVIRDEVHKYRRSRGADMPILVVLDTLMSIVAPSDILDPAKVTETMMNLRMLATTMNVALLILHHTEKTGVIYTGGAQLRNQCDFMLQLTYRQTKGDKGKSTNLRKSPLRVLWNRKQRDEGALVPDIWVEFDLEGGTGYRLPENPPPLPGERQDEGVPTGMGDLANPLGLSPLQQRLLPLYQEGEHSPTELGKALGCDKGTASRAVKELKEKGAIE